MEESSLSSYERFDDLHETVFDVECLYDIHGHLCQTLSKVFSKSMKM